MKFPLMILAVVITTGVFAQSKQELLDQLSACRKSLDSLQAVADNSENVIENRDRSIGFLNEDKTKLQGEKDQMIKLLLQKDAEIARLQRQTAVGKGKLITLNNTRSGWKVPVGKYWVINHVMADYSAAIETDSSGNPAVLGVHVFLRELNGKVIHDASTGNFGPKIYCSTSPEQSIRLPVVFTENTSFSIVVMCASKDGLVLFTGNTIFSITELDL